MAEESVTFSRAVLPMVVVESKTGREEMVTELPTVTVPATVWLAGKLETDTDPATVVTDGAAACTVMAGMVTTFTLTTLATVTVAANAPDTTGALNVTTVGVSVICR